MVKDVSENAKYEWHVGFRVIVFMNCLHDNLNFREFGMHSDIICICGNAHKVKCINQY